MRLCVICSGLISVNEDRRRKTCSTRCGLENARQNRRRKEKEHKKRDRLSRPEKYKLRARLKYARVRAERGERSCRVCGTDISWRFGNARYCGEQCSNTWTTMRARERKPRRTCRQCGETIPSRRFLCDGCVIIEKKKHSSSYVKSAKTFEERLARIARTKQAVKKHNALVRAANQMYCELRGKTKKTKKQKQPRLVRVLRADARGIHIARIRVLAMPLPTCVVCGTALRDYSRKRILCSSQRCKEKRERERSQCTYFGARLSQTPRMIAAADFRCAKTKNFGRFRDPKPPKKRAKRKRSRSERTQREYAVYLAMRGLNLLPTKENTP
jgi:predicted nucleic acid-binding Zn ribbon protein